ncbi:MAG: hypothetical protein Q8P31_07390 [Bacillota bacterium]|nr:hypothetical protein [Bacillota bacterium]
MAKTSGQADPVGPADAELDEETALANELRAILMELANGLASSSGARPSEELLSGLRSELAGLTAKLETSVASEIAALRDGQARLSAELSTQMSGLRAEVHHRLEEAVRNGLDQATREMKAVVGDHLGSLASKLDGLAHIEQQLAETATIASQAVGSASERINREAESFLTSGEATRTALGSSARQLGEQADGLRKAIDSSVPTFEGASRSLQANQESLRALVRGYNDTLDKSVNALETKFAGILATNLERAMQRQIELEGRIRSTAERTEEAVVDLMQGNQAHHQAMVDSTAASLSQLEFFAKAFRRMQSGFNGLFFLATGAVVFLTFVIYLILPRR